MPVLSIDAKQKELLGNFHRHGHYYDKAHRKVNVHDFKSAAHGLIIPHGIYDVVDNLAHLQWKYPNAELLQMEPH